MTESDESFDFQKVTAQVHRDQALASHVLRVANSVAFGGRATRIPSLQQALVRLGTRRVKELVLTVVMRTRVFCSPRFGAHALQVGREAAVAAGLARELARVGSEDSEAAFLCGLLHTVGKPVVLNALSGIEKEVGPLDTALVSSLVDQHYVEAGRRLVEAWNLPEAVGLAILHHSEPGRAPGDSALVVLSAVAGALAPLLLGGSDVEILTSDPRVEALGVDGGAIERALTQRGPILALAAALG